jgi:hypothetical protein
VEKEFYLSPLSFTFIIYMKAHKIKAPFRFTAFFFIFAIFIIACSNKENDFDINKQLPKEIKDTLQVDIVTLMGVKPRYADWQSRHEPGYRSYYIRQAAEYEIAYYHVAPDGRHYFLMIRPTRSPQPGHKRAIGGRFIPGDNFYPQQYEEIFVTKQMDESHLREISESLFISLITGRFEKTDAIEWPDDRLKYDRNKKEWRYDVDE